MGEFRMPSLGADMEAGTLVEWLKQPGDKVKYGDIVAVVETQKGAIEVEVFEDGAIDRLLVQAGTKVPVGTPLALIRTAGAPAAAASPAAPKVATPPPAAPATAPPAVVPSPVRPREPGEPARISPAARKLAAERGLSLAGVRGTGPGGAIVSADLEGVAKAGGEAGPVARHGFDLAEMRKAIAAAMARSKREIPHYYLSHRIDLGVALDWLSSVNAGREPPQRLLLAVLLLKAVALALEEFPEFNGFYADGGFRPSAGIHVGTATAIRGGGLVAPAIRDTGQKTLDELMTALRDVVARVRAGRLRGSELFEPTVTVSSLGERGVESLFGVIYPPQVAIIGFGTPATRPWIVDGRVEPRSIMTVTLAADHRVSDGHRGAMLLLEIERLLQHPETL